MRKSIEVLGSTYEIYFSPVFLEGYLACEMYEKGLVFAEKVIGRSIEVDIDPLGGTHSIVSTQ